MGVSAQHVPTGVAADQGNLGDVQAGFKQSTDAFVAQVVHVNVLYLEPDARSLERGTDRLGVVREDAGVDHRQALDDSHCGAGHRDQLVSNLGGVLGISQQHGACLGVEVGPQHGQQFLAPPGECHGQGQISGHRDEGAGVGGDPLELHIQPG